MIDKSSNIKTRHEEVVSIKSEMLINYLYPEMAQSWRVNNLGSFYRNYTRDLVSFDSNKAEVELSRDGFMKLLPSTLLFREDELRDNKGSDKRDRIEQEQRQRVLLEELFCPIDSLQFKRLLSIERIVAELHNDKISYILRTIFGVVLEDLESIYVQRVALLLPIISRLRGDVGLVRDLIAAVASCRVEMSIGRYSEGDRAQMSLPEVRYSLLVDGLTAEEYREAEQKLQPLYEFLREWFIPFDMKAQFGIKSSHNGKCVMGIMGYNTSF